MGACSTGLSYMHGFGGFHSMMLPWLIIIVVAIYLLTKNRSSIASNFNNISPLSSKKEALDILMKRYAKGELSDEEFETKRRRIQQEL